MGIDKTIEKYLEINEGSKGLTKRDLQKLRKELRPMLQKIDKNVDIEMEDNEIRIFIKKGKTFLSSKGIVARLKPSEWGDENIINVNKLESQSGGQETASVEEALEEIKRLLKIKK